MSNSYTPTEWIPNKTVATADVMNNIEYGILNAHQRVDTLDSQIKEIANYKKFEFIIQKMIKKETVNIVCFGDSVTYGYLNDSQVTNPYPLQLQTLLRNYYNYNGINVYNKGFSGRNSEELSQDVYINEVINLNPDLVIIMLGLNDKLNNNIQGDIDNYVNNLRIISKKLHDYRQLILTSTPSYGNGIWDITNTEQRRGVDLYKNACINLSKTLDVKCFDLNSVVEKYLSHNNLHRIYIQPDLLHFSNDFYKILAEIIFTHNFMTVNAIIENDVYFDCLHGLFNCNNYSYYDGALNNDEKYNLVINTTNKCTIEIFVKNPSLGLYLNILQNHDGKTINVKLNDTIYNLTSLNENRDGENSQHCKDIYIDKLKYGYNKIEINSEMCFITGVSFKTAKEEKKIGLNKISTSTVQSVTSNLSATEFHKYMELQENSIQHRIYFSTTNYAGIGFGCVIYNNIEYPKILIYKTESNITLFENHNNSWSEIGTLTHSYTLGDVITDIIVDIVRKNGKYYIYINNTLLNEYTDLSLLGNLDLYLITHNTGSLNTTTKCMISSVESFNYEIGNNNYELESYYSYSNNKVKTFINDTWIDS